MTLCARLSAQEKPYSTAPESDTLNCFSSDTALLIAQRLAEGTLAMQRAKSCEEKLIAREMQMAAYTAENRNLKTLAKDEQEARQKADLYSDRLTLQVENAKEEINLLKQNNVILKRQANRMWTLSFGIGAGMTGTKQSMQPGFCAGLFIGRTIARF